MLSGGEALENYALHSASSVLAALAKRIPSVAHRKRDSEIVDVELPEVAVGDTLVIYPHDICPVDGVVIEGHGVMDESYLTGEPFQITKTSGSTVISGAINGESALALSVIGMAFAATGHLTPVAGAIIQEVIDVLAVLNALRAAFPPKVIHDL
jgi:P-type E1-E2 ATPase